MPYQKLALGTKSPILSWVNHALDSDEQKMLKNMASLPCVFRHIALMPDAHLGKGAMVGSVIATKDAVIPAAVGVDIGCGMIAVQTPFKAGQLDGKLRHIRLEIERAIPVGFDQHKSILDEAARWSGWKSFDRLHPKVQDLRKKAALQLGTLGGGNHFIEVCLDTDENVWLMLHSGSRNIGNELATRHIETAKHLHRLSELPDKDLAYFVAGTPEFESYWHDLQWAQAYAMKNRELMMKTLTHILAKVLNDGEPFEPTLSVNCHHNYAAVETHYGEEVIVTRKGAVRARKDDYGIIPGSMGAKSYIVRGKGVAESYMSCSHGAGRRLSRNQAKKHFTVADLARETAGVECRKDAGVLDEIPSAYKNIDEVMAAQSDLVEVVAELKQVVCVKG
ncbi:MAG: RtcB family protein [Chloroherpetonaceae bacterium]|nr:RtcB family protein [Chloroherpetonaceae bacterium]MCS7211380.1 RtcB family protein [Chloroherpetonaceae bacterium]MDW8020452.1 RtcB family protein [Chloroherpetonaceae bacterium]MDW8465322.1 RtcB family protein [Chloroherpetonaceae bacterium]